MGSRCKIKQSQQNPLIVEWQGRYRTRLETLSRSQLVVVRYLGCEMQMLSNCRAPGKYVYAGANANSETVSIRDGDELWAKLPLGAAKLEMDLERASELSLRTTIVGNFRADRTRVRRDELEGECDGATHVLSELTVGAFELASMGRAKVGAGATVAGKGAGAKSESDKRQLRQGGDLSSCKQATSEDSKPPSGCGALLAVSVTKLGAAEAPKVACPSGAQWDAAKEQCIRTRVVDKAECPSGSSWDGSRCVRQASCPSGSEDVGGKCVNKQVVTSVSCPGGSKWDGSRCVSTQVAVVPGPRPLPQPKPEPKASGTTPAGMVSVPAGNFWMGCDASDSKCSDDEKPRHQVYVSAFYIDKTEVTVAAYKRCSSCSTPETGTNCNWGKSGRGNHPINCVDWNQAVAYCKSQRKRLPTEAEWEKAARGTSGNIYPWGSAPPAAQACWDGAGNDVGKSNRKSTCAVGSYPSGKSPSGALDMADNVWEWVSDRYDKGYYAKSPSRNPTGPTGGSSRVNRGGCWCDDSADDLRAGSRSYGSPGFRNYARGFRCARPAR